MKQFVDAAMQKGADKAESYFQTTVSEEISFRNNKLKQVSTKKLQGLNLRVVKDGKLGTINTSDLSNPDLLADKVLEVAKFGDQISYDFNQPGIKYLEPSMISSKIYQLSVEELITAGEGLVEKILAYEKNLQVSLEIIRVTNTRKISNSHGLHITSTNYHYCVFVAASLVEGDNFVNSFVSGLLDQDQVNFGQIADELINKVKLARTNVQMESDTYSVIFTPNAVSQIMYTLKGLEAPDVIKGISPLKDKLNTQIFDEKITFIDDGTLAQGYLTASFDDEGTPTQRTVLVENGVLKGYLHDLKSATEMGMSPTGNAWKDQMQYHRPAHTQFTNLIIAPGDVTLEEMISNIKLGIVIDDISGLMMGNIMQGNIDSDIDMAYKIEDGKLVGRVKNGAIGTNVYQILKNNVVAIENQLHPLGFSTFGQSFYLPHILCKDINITIG